MINFKQKTLSFILLRNGLLLVGLLSLTISINHYLAKRIEKINQTISQNKQLSYVLANQGTINSQIRNALSVMPENYETKLTESLLPVNNILPFVEALESLAKKNGIAQTTSFGTPVSADISGPINIMTVPMNVTLNGTNQAALKNYLAEIGKLPYFIKINSINLSALNDKGWDDLSTVNISANFYAKQ